MGSIREALFKHALGVPGQLNHPQVAAARSKVADVSRRHGKFAGTVGSLQDLPNLIDMGYQFVNITADVAILREAFSKSAFMFSEAARKSPATGSAGSHAPLTHELAVNGYPLVAGN